jgi:cell cycle arrest protein BUB3
MEEGQPSPEALALPDPPTDGITSLKYIRATSKSLLASTSWDGCVSIYDTKEKTRQFSHQMDSGPLFSLANVESNDHHHSLVTGGMDGSVRMLDLQSSSTTIVGQHESSSGDSAACSCLLSLAPSSTPSLIASAGWHKKLHIWDVRQKGKAVKTVDLPGKAFAMDLDPTHNRIVVATSGRRTCFIDVRNGSEAELVLDRESSLKYQLRCVRYFPEGDSIAVGSVEGRVAVEYLDELTESTKKSKKYAFKCHRSGDVVYPINCIEFHPRFGTFATGGCDGTVGKSAGRACGGWVLSLRACDTPL